MRDTNLIQLLKTLNKNEFKEFEKFVKSPFYNEGRNYENFFQILKKNYPDFDQDSITKEKIFNQLYPGKPYNDEIIRKIISNLLKLAKQYLSITGLKREPFKIFYPVSLMDELVS